MTGRLAHLLQMMFLNQVIIQFATTYTVCLTVDNRAVPVIPINLGYIFRFTRCCPQIATFIVVVAFGFVDTESVQIEIGKGVQTMAA